MKDLLKISDLSRGDVSYLLSRAQKFKAHPFQRRSLLANETVCMYFSKPSTRTRISFETSVTRLGGAAVMLNASDVQLGRGESIEDTARVISRYSRAFIIRTFKDDDVERFAKAASIPVINALTDGHHPCQALTDLLTLHEHRGALDKCKIAYLGDGNNVAISLMQAAALAGTTIALGCPRGYQVEPALVSQAKEVAKKNGSDVIVTDDPEEAARNSDALYTDVWLSMGDAEQTRAARFEALSPFQVTSRLMGLAKPNAIFMHCLPAHRGEEVAADVADAPSSVIFDQAENRLHVAMAVLYALLERKLEGAKV
jgi:ornithine carbamoyltransferase